MNAKAEKLIRRCCEILIAAEGDLNALDAKSGDGDTGSTLETASRVLIKALGRLPLADWTQLHRAIGLELSQTMGGSSGVLLAIFFTAAGDASAGGHDAIAALKAGLMRIQQVGGASPGDRTIIDALAQPLNHCLTAWPLRPLLHAKVRTTPQTSRAPKPVVPAMCQRVIWLATTIRELRLSRDYSRSYSKPSTR